MSEIKIIIDGIECVAQSGETVLDIAKKNGIYIPTLCHDESVAKMTAEYVAKLHTAMDMKTTVKKEDKTNPVVELTATTLNQEGAAKVAENNADLVALGTAYGELQAQGLTEEQLKASPEFQEFALESINKFIDEFPLNPESSIEITCEAVEGSDGKLYWAPKNPEEVAKFVTGQK